MIRSILVPLDGSTFGEHALPIAMAMAKRMEASLNLIHVHSLLDATYAELQVFDNTLDQELRKKEREYLHDVQRKVQDHLSVPVTIRNVDGDTASVIAEQADSLRVSWVVMSTHARGPMGRFWLGSVTDELIRTLPIPLIAVHPAKTSRILSSDRSIEAYPDPARWHAARREYPEPAWRSANRWGPISRCFASSRRCILPLTCRACDLRQRRDRCWIASRSCTELKKEAERLPEMSPHG